MRSVVPVVDLFAGPGGLGEGFAAFKAPGMTRATFKIVVSIEKDYFAHQTLELRAFFRQFIQNPVPPAYYQYLRKEITREDLFRCFPVQASAARHEARLAELGTDDDSNIHNWIRQSLARKGSSHWILIGGPPCQAYSVIGRSRMKTTRANFEDDHRHFLYRQYLQILGEFRPSAFVMENVKGILSANINDEPIFDKIRNDLSNPVRAIQEARHNDPSACRHVEQSSPLEYRIYSLVVPTDTPETLRPTDFVIEAEKYGIPQTRHRVILLGIRSDISIVPRILNQHPVLIPARSVLHDLTPLRSCLSRNQKEAKLKDSEEQWRGFIAEILTKGWISKLDGGNKDLFSDQLRSSLENAVQNLRPALNAGAEYAPATSCCPYRPDWYHDPALAGILNHTARAHMGEDLHRYLFAACYARVYGISPKMRDFPTALLPEHKNIQTARLKGVEEDFDDRFRVQVADRPATTITSHISKDGHYHIHYDPTQCRSLTVREAARLQTFPDNYFFEGPRTQQYLQVGNAVPPLLAYQIAGVLYDLFEQIDAPGRRAHRGISADPAPVVADERERLPVAP